MDYESLIVFSDAVLSRKDPYNHHGINVSSLAVKIGSKINLNEEEMNLLNYGARLHDIGKMLLTDELLNFPGKFATGQYERAKNHASLGYDLLKSIGVHSIICDIAHLHHEHYDGSGYPHGLQGDKIPLLVRIVTISDVWDSLTSNRSYRKAITNKEALAEMDLSCNWFDPDLYKIFLGIENK